MKTVSVSKGCFAFKGNIKHVKAGDFLNDNENAHLCLNGHKEVWHQADQKFQKLQSDMVKNLFENLFDYIASCYTDFNLNYVNSKRKSARAQEIPTAVLITGVNTPDHAVMFSSLTQMLQNNISPLVASLSSKTCTTIRSTIHQVLNQILKQSSSWYFKDDYEEEEDQDTELYTKQSPCTLNTLANWYSDKYKKTEDSPSPKKKKCLSDQKSSSSSTYPKVIIIFEDIESFAVRPLQDFISMCSCYLSQLPVIFIFGVATTLAAVHGSLPKTVSSLLCMEKFQAPVPSEYLTRLLNEVVMTADVPFKLGPKVFEYLLDSFLFHNFSILNFIKGLQFSILDHFFSYPFSYLCVTGDRSKDVAEILMSANPEEIRQIPSFMKHVEICTARKQKSLLLNDKLLKEEVGILLQEMHSYHKNFFPILTCLHTLVRKLPKYPLGKQLRELYVLCLKNNIYESEAYSEAMNLLKFLSQDELHRILNQCQDNFFKMILPEILCYIPNKLCSFLERLEQLDDLLFEESSSENEMKVAEQTSLPKRMSLHNLQKTLQEMDKKKKKLTPYEKLQAEILSFMDEIFRKYLQCPTTLPLYEVFYYDSISTLRECLSASPRAVLQKALSNPHHYLKCSCCESDPGIILPSNPDICVAYKLHLECGKLINLYDWLQSFITVVDENRAVDEKLKNSDKLLQYPFCLELILSTFI